MKNINHKSPQLLIQLGKRLKEIRLEKGYPSIQRFAYKADISRVLYSRYEAGKGNITFKNLTKILNSLDASFKEFFSKEF